MYSTTTRQRRAIEQAPAYQIRRAVTSGEGEGFSFWVVNAEKRSLYLVHQGTCTCPDHQKRGVKCKHILMVERHLGIGEELPAEEPEPVIFESLTPREYSLQDADERCSPEDYEQDEENSFRRPTLEEEIELAQDDEHRRSFRDRPSLTEERYRQIKAEQALLWP